jgi:hypothetical protein
MGMCSGLNSCLRECGWVADGHISFEGEIEIISLYGQRKGLDKEDNHRFINLNGVPIQGIPYKSAFS